MIGAGLGGTLFWVVMSGLSEFSEEENANMEEEGDDDWEDPEEVHEEGWCMNRQKFQAWDLVKIYASILLGNWADEYLVRDEMGVIEIVDI